MTGLLGNCFAMAVGRKAMVNWNALVQTVEEETYASIETFFDNLP